MIAKFVYVADNYEERGVQQYHRNWESLYKDTAVGDSLANTARHWNGECVVHCGFIFIGGRDSITAVLNHEAGITLKAYDDQGVVIAFLRAKDAGLLSKHYTAVLVQAKSVAPSNHMPVTTLGGISLLLRGLSEKSIPDVSLDKFRSEFSVGASLQKQYGNV